MTAQCFRVYLVVTWKSLMQYDSISLQSAQMSHLLSLLLDSTKNKDYVKALILEELYEMGYKRAKPREFKSVLDEPKVARFYKVLIVQLGIWIS